MTAPHRGTRVAEGWIFERAVAPPCGPEPISLRHPEVSGTWRHGFEPPLPIAWYRLDWSGAEAGVVDARLILVFEDGARLPQPLAKIGRNRCRALFRPVRAVAAIEMVLAGSSAPESWPRPVLGTVSAWEQRRALLRRCLDVLKGDPRSLVWRAARFLIQWQRQGRTAIPVSSAPRVPAEAYRIWRDRFDERDDDRPLHEGRLAALKRRPLFSVVAEPGLGPGDAEALAASLRAQVYDRWELFLPEGASSDGRIRPLPEETSGAAWFDDTLRAAQGSIVIPLRPGTVLRPHALLVFALALDRVPGARLLYADDDDLGPAGRSNPRFKPAWSPTRALSWDYLGDPCGFDAALLRSVGAAGSDAGAAWRHDLVLKASALLDRNEVVHVAQVLSHTSPVLRAASPDDMAVVRARAEGLTLRALADPRSPHPRVVSGAGEPPLVSIIIPTRDRADLLRMSVGSIRAKTRYPTYEILVVDNGSREAETLRLFESWAGDPVIRVLKDARPFNYAALNNAAAAQARGSMLALVNNDIEVIDPLWLDEMVGLARRPGVGCVGAKLFYPDGRLQHGGVVTGVGGAAGHRHKRAPRTAAGMLDCLVTVNEVSAVTAACLVVSKAVYEEVGGLDAETFAVGYNDVDFCLRVAAAGYRNLWTPFAELNHHESVSRGRDLSPRTVERFNREVLALRLRWGERLIDDPYASPNLTLDSEDGGIRMQ